MLLYGLCTLLDVTEGFCAMGCDNGVVVFGRAILAKAANIAELLAPVEAIVAGRGACTWWSMALTILLGGVPTGVVDSARRFVVSPRPPPLSYIGIM